MKGRLQPNLYASLLLVLALICCGLRGAGRAGRVRLWRRHGG